MTEFNIKRYIHDIESHKKQRQEKIVNTKLNNMGVS